MPFSSSAPPARAPSLRVAPRRNAHHRGCACLSFLIVLPKSGTSRRKEDYKYFLLMNSSVRGPFLPKYFHQHWTEAMLSLLIDRTNLVGLAVNCPDGIGDLIPHVMTMAMAMTQEAVKLGFEKGIFNCAGTYKSAVPRYVRRAVGPRPCSRMGSTSIRCRQSTAIRTGARRTNTSREPRGKKYSMLMKWGSMCAMALTWTFSFKKAGMMC